MWPPVTSRPHLVGKMEKWLSLTSFSAERVFMSAIRVHVALLGFFLFALYGAAAQEPFYQGRRLTILVNYAPGGSTDAEARVFVRHIGRVLDGQPGVIIQNMEGAGGFVGAKYVGEVAPRDGTLLGYFTATP